MISQILSFFPFCECMKRRLKLKVFLARERAGFGHRKLFEYDIVEMHPGSLLSIDEAIVRCSSEKLVSVICKYALLVPANHDYSHDLCIDRDIAMPSLGGQPSLRIISKTYA